MKFKGKYAKDVIAFTDCEILIEYGKLQRVKFNSRQVFNTSSPSDKSLFELEKISSDPVEFIPVKHNYVINYIGQHNEPCKIYLRLNPFQKLKFRFHIYYYSDKAKIFLTDIIKLMIGGLLGVLGTLFVQSVNHQTKDEPITEPTNEIQTVRENTNDQTMDKIIKTDSIIDNNKFD